VASTELLTSRSERIKSARKLTRRASRVSGRRFLAEGRQALGEALRRPGTVEQVFSTADARIRYDELVEAAESAGVPWQLADRAAIAALTQTVTPQGIVAVCRFVDVPLEAVVAADPRLVALCADMRDPGNAGSVIRAADAAGADAVVLAGNTVDPYNGKCVRASVGSLFHLPVVFGAGVGEAVERLRGAGVTVLAADGGGESLDDLVDDGSLAEPTAWLFGNEAWGLPVEAARLADRVVGIPVYGQAESLNLATAATMCLYASARAQRSQRH
jgi:TrmH family RNA methyltransferase